MVVEHFVAEDGMEDDATEDPYVKTTPSKLLEYVTVNKVSVVD